jgi:phosphoribosylformylglycinamidine (FGAM) synthase-like amidotransferase family enzyme
MSALPRSVSNSSRPGSRPRPLPVGGAAQVNAQAAIRQQTSQVIFESATILGINLVLIGTAIFTLANLLPQQLTRNQKLQEVRLEEAQVTNRINELNQDLQRSQNPQVERRIAEEYGSFMRADQHQVVLMEPTRKVQ